MASTVKDDEIAVEQVRVNEAYLRLDEMRAGARRMIEEGYRQAQAGTLASLVDRDAMVHQAALRAQSLDIAEDGLVFGRLDLTTVERLYVGRVGIRTSEHDSLVIDWRAPAAEVFYRATPEDPRGVVRRRVLHCRGRSVVDLEDDLLDPAAGADLTIVGDGAFIASLARAREGTMRDIVATIQREQDEVIRAPADGTVIVRGAPGTGKTAVALHRVAYLLFRHRRRFGSRGVLIVGPNRRFTAYIERVLPSLGEGGAVLRSLGDLFPGVDARRHDTPEVTRIKGAAVMSRVLRRAVQDAPPDAPGELRAIYRGVVIKLDRDELDRVRRDVHRRSHGAVNLAYPRAAELLLAALWNRFTEVGGLDDAPDADRAEFLQDVRDDREFVGFLREWWPVRRAPEVLRSLADAGRLRRAARRDLTAVQVTAVAASLRDDFSYQDVALLDEIATILGPPPRPSRKRRKKEDPFVIDGVDVFTGEQVEAEEEPELRELTTYIERREQSARTGETDDDEDEEYAHIVVDEAQDLSPMQWRMLGRRGRQATWTIVEDPAQSAWEDLDASAAAMDSALGRRTRHEYVLTTNYRNSVEIAELAARVLRKAVPGAVPARAVRSSGHVPVVRHVTDLPTAIAEEAATLATQVEGTIGVILPVGHPLLPGSKAEQGQPSAAKREQTSRAAQEQTSGVGQEQISGAGQAQTELFAAAAQGALFSAAAEGGASPGAGVVVDTPGTLPELPERVQVLDALEAKGLEFDAALIVEPGLIADYSPTGLRTLYVAVSRATQRLSVLSSAVTATLVFGER